MSRSKRDARTRGGPPDVPSEAAPPADAPQKDAPRTDASPASEEGEPPAPLPRSFAEVLFDGAATWRLFVATAGLFAIGLLGICGALWFFEVRSVSTGGFTMELNRGAVVFRSGSEVYAIRSVAASAGWLDTGVDIKPGETWTLRASGSAHLGVHHLVDCGLLDLAPKTPWVQPEPEERETPGKSRLERQRNDLKVAPLSKYGSLLILLLPEEEGTPALESSYLDHHPKARLITYLERIDGVKLELSERDRAVPHRVFLCINDQVLDNQDLYTGDLGLHVDHLSRLSFRWLSGMIRKIRTGADHWSRLEGALLEAFPDLAGEVLDMTSDFELERRLRDLHATDDQEATARLARLSLTVTEIQWDLFRDEGERKRIYFDDNLGSYLVQLSRRSPGPDHD